MLPLLDPSVPAMVAMATGLVALSAARAAQTYHQEMSELSRHRASSPPATVTVETAHALFFPVSACCVLVVLFYLFSRLSIFLVLLITLASSSSLYFTLSPILPPLSKSICRCLSFSSAQYSKKDSRSTLLLSPSLILVPLRSFQRAFFPGSPSPSPSSLLPRLRLLLLLLSLAIPSAWLLSGHWLLLNCLGAALCVALTAHLRLPSLRTACLLLLALLAYDVFWVFLSERWFGANVMVTVAVQQAHNPLHSVSSRLSLPPAVARAVAPRLDLPLKLLLPRAASLWPAMLGSRGGRQEPREFLMLGLGDMALPALLVTLCLLLDHRAAHGCRTCHACPACVGRWEAQQQRPRHAAEGKDCREEEELPAEQSRLAASDLCLDDVEGRGSAPSGRAAGAEELPCAHSALDEPEAARRSSGPPAEEISMHGVLPPWRSLHFALPALGSYACGLSAAMVAAAVSDAAQPALLYIVPCMLVTLVLKAVLRKQLGLLWKGPPCPSCQ